MNKQFGLPAPRRGGGGKPKDSDNHDNPHMKARVQKVYRHFRTATMGGCNGSSNGLDGSLSPIWMFRVLQFLGVFGETVVDLGASDGRVLASARISCSFRYDPGLHFLQFSI